MPRSISGVSNWEHTVTSSPDRVYLTTGYALFFAAQAADGDDELVVLEIDIPEDEYYLLRPDEDALEQIENHKSPEKQRKMRMRTAYFRDHAHEYHYEQSLSSLGTVAFEGVIKPEWIKRVAIITVKMYAKLVMRGYDPSISILNYLIIGKKYEEFMAKLFDISSEEVEVPIHSLRIEIPENRDGIRILDAKTAKLLFAV